MELRPGPVLKRAYHQASPIKVFVALVGATMLASCATRQVDPVHMVQAGDANLTCMQLDAQLGANEAAAREFLKKDKQVEQGNTAKNIGSAIPMVGVFLLASTDLSNSEQIKARALMDRDEQLKYLKKRKGCPL